MLDWCRVLALCVCLSEACSLHSAADQGPLYTLYNDLLKNYKTYIRPRKNPSESVDVHVSYSLASVEALEENTQTLISTGYLWLEWSDDLLTWNSDRYGNITEITIPVDKLWFPDLVLLNGLDDPPLIYPEGETARVSNDGRIQWYKWIRKRTKCPLDMRKFPFDTQKCSINFHQWSSVMTEINMTADWIRIEPAIFQRNGEWEVVGTSEDALVHSYAETDIQIEMVFTFVFERKYLYYVITSIFPVMLLSVLNLGVFLLPPETGEKVSLCISIVLSYAVYMSAISGRLPDVSDTVSIFSIYLLAMMFLKVTTTLITVAILNVYYGDTAKEWLDVNSTSNDRNETEIESVPHNQRYRYRTPRNMSERNIATRGRKQLAALLNKIGFCIIFPLTVTLTIVCFVLLLKT
ncbi:neuronal acetylcholine receptor subunit alpha-6-like [Haliotis asinina]|uniref:neuronal acetylcholine receptor subunit alpha-6-like n=1 Tax=Haliotis asinina TaxID=109174 RepID=UPI003531D7CE